MSKGRISLDKKLSKNFNTRNKMKIKNLGITVICAIIGISIGAIILALFDRGNIDATFGQILGVCALYIILKLQTRKSKCILPVVRKSVAKKKAKQPVKCPTCKFNKGEYCNVGEHKFYGLQSVICFEGEEYEKATVS